MYAARVVFESASIDLPGGRFAYLATGDTGAPVALCLHGFPDHAPSWMAVMRALADAGYRAVAPWMRGYMPSTLEGPFDIHQLADDAVTLATALSPGARVALLGHDWGALAAYGALARAPRRFFAAVTMAVPHPGSFLDNVRREPSQLARSWYIGFFQLRGVAEWAVARDDYAFIDRLWRAWSPSYRQPPGDAAELKRCLRASMPAPLLYYRAIAHVSSLVRTRIAVPTLMLHGARDGCISAEIGRDQERLFTGPFRSVVLDHVGHFLQLEDPAAVAGLVIPWLREHHGSQKSVAGGR